MTTIKLSIEGMHCAHCVAAVGEAIRAVPGVSATEVAIGSAIVTAGDPPPIDALREAVEDAGYFAEVAPD